MGQDPIRCGDLRLRFPAVSGTGELAGNVHPARGGINRLSRGPSPSPMFTSSPNDGNARIHAVPTVNFAFGSSPRSSPTESPGFMPFLKRLEAPGELVNFPKGDREDTCGDEATSKSRPIPMTGRLVRGYPSMLTTARSALGVQAGPRRRPSAHTSRRAARASVPQRRESRGPGSVGGCEGRDASG